MTTDSLVYMPVAMSRRWGKGEVILVSTPLIFTNYGMLDGKNATYIFRLLSQMGKLPIVRTEGYMKETAQVQQSPFRYLLAHQPLRWALYLTMITIILFMKMCIRDRGEAAVHSIMEERSKNGPFLGIFDFVQRVNLNAVEPSEAVELISKDAEVVDEAIEHTNKWIKCTNAADS